MSIKLIKGKPDEELLLLCEWFNSLKFEDIPNAQIELCSGVQVSDNKLFYEELRKETAAQEISGPRVITGSLKWTLQCLYKVVNG